MQFDVNLLLQINVLLPNFLDSSNDLITEKPDVATSNEAFMEFWKWK